jgi:hypothetical protein
VISAACATRAEASCSGKGCEHNAENKGWLVMKPIGFVPTATCGGELKFPDNADNNQSGLSGQDVINGVMAASDRSAE